VLREYGLYRRMAEGLGNFKPISAELHWHRMVRGLFSRSNKSSGRWVRMARTWRRWSSFRVVRSSQAYRAFWIGRICLGHDGRWLTYLRKMGETGPLVLEARLLQDGRTTTILTDPDLRATAALSATKMVLKPVGGS
jgi:hypothetical protein